MNERWNGLFRAIWLEIFCSYRWVAKYLEWLGTEEPELIITEDTLEYNRKYLNKSEFLKFAEYYFKDDMHHNWNRK